MINPRKNDPLFEKFLHKRVEISSKNMEFGKYIYIKIKVIKLSICLAWNTR